MSVELLAPAGNFESLKTAIINGADAIYLGLDCFNARINAQNFTLKTLKQALDYAHLFNVKIYLTLNTLIRENELNSAVSLAKNAWDLGIDAVIVQDLGLVQTLKRLYPQIVLHASTQMGVHNLLGAKIAQDLGISRVILSRETPLTEIENISKNCSIELEYFVHGALCCGFSGNCYISSVMANKSGNRGKCLQLCRKPYILSNKTTKEKAFWLSTRDTMLINQLKNLIDAGIISFKIEGRMKRSQYVGEVTRIYKKALENCQIQALSEDIDKLKLMFNRGNFSQAHLNGVDNNIIYPKLPSHLGIKIGNVISVKNTQANLDCTLNKGDGIKFLKDGFEVGNALALKTTNSTGFVGNVSVGCAVHLTDSSILNTQINLRKRKLPLSIESNFSLNKNLCKIKLKSNQNSCEFSYNISLQEPKNSPLLVEDIKNCLTSLGNTNFECINFSFCSDYPFFATISSIKEIKRQFINDFEQYLIDNFKRDDAKNDGILDVFSRLNPLKTPKNCKIVMCQPHQAIDYQNLADYIAIKPQDYSQLLQEIKNKTFKSQSNFLLDLPTISFKEDILILNEIINENVFFGYIINNLGAINLVLNTNASVILGYKMNQLNNAINFPKIMSIESNLTKNQNEFVYAFGCLDLMQTVHCYHKLKNSCKECSKNHTLNLTDDKNETYSIKKQRIHNCYNLITATTPLTKINSSSKLFFDATNLSQSQSKTLQNLLSNSN